MPVVRPREAARRDLIEHFVYLAENAGLAVADRFLSCAEGTFGDLAQQPMMGAPLDLKRSELANLRKWRVKDFDNHLVFYEHARMACPSCACCMRPVTGGGCWASIELNEGPSRSDKMPEPRRDMTSTPYDLREHGAGLRRGVRQAEVLIGVGRNDWFANRDHE